MPRKARSCTVLDYRGRGMPCSADETSPVSRGGVHARCRRRYRSDHRPSRPSSLVAEYRARNAASCALFRRAQAVLPGGNTRTGVFVDPFPLYVDHAAGVELVDVDGNRRLDFVNNASALILGHAHPAVVAAIAQQAGRGTAYFAPGPPEVELAELLAERIPSLERLRFCSSGTEAVLGALRAARAFTGRPMIAKFEGAYHGIDDPALISYLPPPGPALGPATRPRPIPASAGLAPGTAEQVLVLPFNDSAACAALLREHAERLAAVIVDPLSTAAGLTLPAPGFLETLRRLTGELGIVLIFDEVVSFRAGAGGAQGRFGVRPDLTCLAKVVAGGTPAERLAAGPTSWRCTTPPTGRRRFPNPAPTTAIRSSWQPAWRRCAS